MSHQRIRRLLLTVIPAAALGLLISSAFAAKEAPVRRVIDPTIYKVMQYSFPYPQEPTQTSVAPRGEARQQLDAGAPSASPGIAVGGTWHDLQHVGSMGRMNETGTGVNTIAHFSWMFLPERVLDQSRAAKYDSYDITNQAFGAETYLQPNDHYAGYVNLNVSNDNRAIVGCHNRDPNDNHNDPTFYFDFVEGGSFFAGVYEVPQSVTDYAEMEADQEVIWPKFAYSEGSSDTVLHVVAQVNLAGTEYNPDQDLGQAIYYFRRPYSDMVFSPAPYYGWDNPPYVIDTVYNLSHAIAATDNGKVALAWTANIPCDMTDPAIASCNTGVAPAQWNNDVYYMISNNYGVSWPWRTNLTNNREYHYSSGSHYGEASYRPYTDMGVLIDVAGNLHVVWGAAYWNEEGDIFFRNRIFHWSENQPYLRTAYSADWDQTTCNGGAWQLNASKMSISECNGRFYVLFVQFNDRNAGIMDDCARDDNPGYPVGSANGDLYVVISEDGGLTWDQARNLTNSRTPGCDSVGGMGGPCESDHWPSMSAFGTDEALAPGDNVTSVVVPAGGSNNGWYLDVQYINDHSAGAVVMNEGTWQESDVRWFRMACVAAVTAPNPILSPIEISFPAWTKMNRPYNRNVVIENLGNANYTYAIMTVEDPSVPAGISAGWLTYSNFDGSVPFGLNNTETGTITITPTGGYYAGIYTLSGRLIFMGNSPTSPDTFEIRFVVADTLYPPEVDTVHTAVLALVGNNSGAVGEEGDNKVNMDYVATGGDCDTLAQVYLNTGSSVIAYIKGAIDTVANFSAFGNSYVSPVGFFPFSNTESFDTAGAEAFKSVALTRDSSLAIQTTIFAPKPPAAGDSSNFILKRLRIYPKDGAAHNNISIGEAIDWDIPADSGSDNGSDFNATEKMIWQYGGEYHQDDTGWHPACQDSDARFGGIKFLQMKKNATDLSSTAPVNAYTSDNPTWVYGNPYGFVPAEIFTQMETEAGFSKYESAHPDSVFTDLHTVMTFTNNMNFAAMDTVTIWMAFITIKEGTASGFSSAAAKAKRWWENHLQPPFITYLCGDVNNDNRVIISDLTYYMNYLIKGGPAPHSMPSADVDHAYRVTLRDAVFLNDFLFHSGPALTCPAGSVSLDPPLDTNVNLELVHAILPKNQTSVRLQLKLLLPDTIISLLMPIQVLINGEKPDSVANFSFSDEMPVSPQLLLDAIPFDSGSVLLDAVSGIGTYYAYLRGYYEFVSFDVFVSPEPIDRPVTIDFDSLPPIQDGMPVHTPWVLDVSPWFDAVKPFIRTCCRLRGDVDSDNAIVVTDLTFMVNYLFRSGAEPPCFYHADADRSDHVNVSDLVYLVNYLFRAGPLPPACD